MSQDQKLLEVKKHSPPTPGPKPRVSQKLQKVINIKQLVHLAPKPQDHQKLQASNSVDAMQIPRRKTKHKGRWGERGERGTCSFVPSLLQKTLVTVTSAVKRLAVPVKFSHENCRF